MPVRARLVPLMPLVLLLGSAALAACPAPQSPKGPPPEYEEPPAPSWLLEGGADGGSEGGSALTDAGDLG